MILLLPHTKHPTVLRGSPLHTANMTSVSYWKHLCAKPLFYNHLCAKPLFYNKTTISLPIDFNLVTYILVMATTWSRDPSSAAPPWPSTWFRDPSAAAPPRPPLSVVPLLVDNIMKAEKHSRLCAEIKKSFLQSALFKRADSAERTNVLTHFWLFPPSRLLDCENGPLCS
jgi:hypothetical protein